MKSGDGLAPGGRRRWGRAVLVCGQIVVSIVVLVLALGIYRDVGRDLARGPGYRTDHLLMMSVAPGLVRYTDARSAALYASLADRARALPGVTRVALTTAVPMSNEIDDESIVPEGYQLPPGTDKLNVLAARVDEHFFETIGVGIVRGRGFSGDDRLGSPPVAIVNEQAARRFWPEQEAIGKRLRLNDENRTQVQVVGIAKTTTYGYLGERPQEFVYFPYRQKKTVSHIVMLIQSAGDPAGLAAPLREIVRDLDADLPVFNVRTMEEFYRIQATSGANVMVGTVAALGVMALGLAFSGLYGLVWYNASRRTRELGIRIAVGATRTTVVALILRQAIVLAAVGVACGAAASVAVDVVFDAVFPGPETQRNFAAVLAVIPVVLAVTFAAAYLPARRACRVNPMDALRVE